MPMKHLECPDCGSEEISKSLKLRMVFWGGNFECPECGCSMFAKGSWLNTLVGAVVGSVILYFIFYGLASGNWWPAIALVLSSLALTVYVSYSMGLGRVGSKRFRL